MGDSQAVELAQSCHLRLAQQHGIVDSGSLTTNYQAVPRAEAMVGLVIDDFVSLSKVKRSLFKRRSSDGAQRVENMQKVYQDVKLIPNVKKGFRDELQCSFWGAGVNRENGLIRGSLQRAVPLDWSLQWLLLMAILFPLAATNMRAKAPEIVAAADATYRGEAGVYSRIPRPIGKELTPHCLRKSVWVRLLPPSQAVLRGHGVLPEEEELPDREACFRSNPLWTLLAEGLNYKLLFATRRDNGISTSVKLGAF